MNILLLLFLSKLVLISVLIFGRSAAADERIGLSRFLRFLLNRGSNWSSFDGFRHFYFV